MPKNDFLFRRIFFIALLLYCCAAGNGYAQAYDEDAPRYRALLIACDQFVEATEMTPIGENNLQIMKTVLAQDSRGFDIKSQYGITSSKETLAYAVKWAFSDAREQDVSLLYISTHGDFVTSHNNPHGVLLLSDGSLEDRMTAQELNEILDEVPGTKVVLVDACNSGALIAKGVSPDVGAARVARTFQSEDYKVLTSSGASEPSWYLQPTLEHAPPGSSYFTTAMAVGAGLIGGYAADANRDGVITLREMYEHLWVNQASSVVQMFPQEDDFPLFVYDKGRLTEEAHGELTGFVFGPTALDREQPMLQFEYTATVPTRVAYRITYLRGNQWDWAHGETLRDRTEFDGDMDPMGDISPGRKQITLDLSDILPEDWMYAMVHIMTLANASEGGQPFIYASRVLRAKTPDTDLKLDIRTSMRWDRKTRAELEIFVHHMAPCTLSISIHDANGELVRRLISSKPTRPQALHPEGSIFYWNGLDADRERVPPGEYTVHVEARSGEMTYTAETALTIQ